MRKRILWMLPFAVAGSAAAVAVADSSGGGAYTNVPAAAIKAAGYAPANVLSPELSAKRLELCAT